MSTAAAANDSLRVVKAFSTTSFHWYTVLERLVGLVRQGKFSKDTKGSAGAASRSYVRASLLLPGSIYSLISDSAEKVHCSK